MVDIQQQYAEAFRQKKQMFGSPQGASSSVGSSSGRIVSPPHPVSLAKALEMSNQQSVGSDCNDSCSCTGDSGFDEYTPLSTSWHKKAAAAAAVVQTKRKLQSLKLDPDPQQDYANITIINPISPPQQHTNISRLAPIYSTRLSQTPSPPTDHTTIGAVGPMYNTISIEEQEAGVCMCVHVCDLFVLNACVCFSSFNENYCF